MPLITPQNTPSSALAFRISSGQTPEETAEQIKLILTTMPHISQIDAIMDASRIDNSVEKIETTLANDSVAYARQICLWGDDVFCSQREQHIQFSSIRDDYGSYPEYFARVVRALGPSRINFGISDDTQTRSHVDTSYDIETLFAFNKVKQDPKFQRFLSTEFRPEKILPFGVTSLMTFRGRSTETGNAHKANLQATVDSSGLFREWSTKGAVRTSGRTWFAPVATLSVLRSSFWASLNSEDAVYYSAPHNAPMKDSGRLRAVAFTAGAHDPRTLGF